MSNLQIVIIAGGQNSRFYPFNTASHKGFTTICGMPLIIRQIKNLSYSGYKDIVIIVSPKDYDQEKFNLLLEQHNIDLNIPLVLQKEALGMGNALLCAKDNLSKRFAVIHPYHTSSGEFLNKMENVNSENSIISVSQTDRPWEFGIASVEGEKAIGIVEKPEKGSETSNLKVLGIYILTLDYLKTLEQTTEEEYSFETALNQHMQQNFVSVYKAETDLPSLKYPWHLFGIWQDMIKVYQTKIDPGANVAETVIIDDSQGPVVIEKGAVIGHASRIVGPCYIGENSLVGDFTLFRESCLEKEAKIGVHGDITRSIFMSGSTFHGGGFIGDSIIGEGTKIGAGLIVANKRFDRANIQIKVKDKKIDANTNALGLICGQNVKIGIGVKVMPGTVLPENFAVYPGEIIKGKN